MNSNLILGIASEAEEQVCLTRKLSDGSTERSWKAENFYLKFAELLIQDLMLNVHKVHPGSVNKDSFGVWDVQREIQNRIKERYLL